MMMIDDDDGAKICTHAHMGSSGTQIVMGKKKLKLRKNLPFFKKNFYIYFMTLYSDKY